MQACKALREEGFRVILVNSNPATIMTDPEMADATYIEPVNWRTVARIIEKERPDALLPTMGGQTALNTALDLVREGVLEKFEVEMIGASRRAIDMAEDREQFKVAMNEIGLKTPASGTAHTVEEARAVVEKIGLLKVDFLGLATLTIMRVAIGRARWDRAQRETAREGAGREATARPT